MDEKDFEIEKLQKENEELRQRLDQAMDFLEPKYRMCLLALWSKEDEKKVHKEHF